MVGLRIGKMCFEYKVATNSYVLGDLIHNMVIIVNNTELQNSKLLRDFILTVLNTQKHDNYDKGVS